MIGKILFSVSFFFIIFLDNGFASDKRLSDFFKKVEKIQESDFLIFEDDFNKQFKAFLVEKNNQCLDQDLLISEQTDQSRCYDELKVMKRKYIDLKFAKKSQMLTDSFNKLKKSLSELYILKIKSIQSSSPEDPLFFEL